MTMLEIVLLLCGGLIVILGFVVPVSSEETKEETVELAQDEIHRLVAEEMENIRQHVDDTVDEAIEYAMEKTERSLERLSNEKIMAVNEYSDTVLQEIHKNHEEVMFLYDMLNDKHNNITQTVTQVNSAVKAVEASKREAEEAVENFKQLTPETVKEMQTDDFKVIRTFEAPRLEKINTVEEIPDTSKLPDIARENRNEEILKLYQQGKKTVAIAKELGLGVGEVKLVIDLYRNLS